MCKKLKIICLSLCLLLPLSSVGFCGVTYQITEQQFKQLEQNLNQLDSLTNVLSVDSIQSAEQLTKALYELKVLKEQLKMLQTETIAAKTDLQKANDLLTKQSQSLKALEAQEKKLKRNNFYLQIVAAFAVGYAAIK